MGARYRSEPSRVRRNNKRKRTYRLTERTRETKARLYKPFISFKETDLGISEFIGTTPGFEAIIKSRFSDFHVNEIDLDGNFIKLTDISVPPTPKDPAELEMEKKNLDDYLVKEKLLTLQHWKSIKTLISGGNNKPVEIDVSRIDKEKRTEIHNALRQHFGGKVVTTTVIKANDIKFITVERSSALEKQDKREKWSWPAEYTYFTVYKENYDTMKIASILAKRLNCKPAAIAYAGTKDKRAKTSQLFCIKKRNPEQIAKAARKLYPCMRVGNFHFRPQTLRLGDLKANHFRIALRNVKAEVDVIAKSIQTVEEKGFINYYGLQRFGTCVEVPTHEIGKALLKGNWQEACELILKPREVDAGFMKQAREFWWKTRDSKETLDKLQFGNCFIESKLLEGIVKHGKTDTVLALSLLPRNVRLLYIHSYQSLIWNRIVSRRTKEWGLELREGDLVFNENVDPVLCEKTTELSLAEIEELDAVFGENKGVIIEEHDPLEVEEKMSKFKALARPLTAEDIKSGKYTIHDLVLPLPGYDILYPSNECADWYAELLAADDLSSEKLKHKVRDYALPGNYRRVIVKPEGMKWKTVEYFRHFDSLIESDLEELYRKQPEKIFPKVEDVISEIKEPAVEDATPEIKDADETLATEEVKEKRISTAILLEFTLPSSCYATMLLREVLKIDTSLSNQIKLNREVDERMQGAGEGEDNDENGADESKTDEQITEEDKEEEDKEKVDEETPAKKQKVA